MGSVNSVWGITWLGSWGDSWGSIAVEEEPSRYRSPSISVSGGDDSSKVHLVELYAKNKQLEIIEKKKRINHQDNDLIALLGFMISARVIT